MKSEYKNKKCILCNTCDPYFSSKLLEDNCIRNMCEIGTPIICEAVFSEIKKEIRTWNLFHCTFYYGKASLVASLLEKSKQDDLAINSTSGDV